MDARIGAPGALRQGFFAGEVFESGHQCPLNGHSVRLDLPSGEVMAVISEREFEISWQTGTGYLTVGVSFLFRLLFAALTQRLSWAVARDLASDGYSLIQVARQFYKLTSPNTF